MKGLGLIQATELEKVPNPAILDRKKYLAIPGSVENIYRKQAYELIIVDFQHRELRKPLYYANYINTLMFFCLIDVNFLIRMLLKITHIHRNYLVLKVRIAERKHFIHFCQTARYNIL